MSDYERIKGKLFLVEEVSNGEKSLEEWCEFYVKYVLGCYEIYRVQKQLMQVSSYTNFLEKCCPNQILILNSKLAYVIHVEEVEDFDPSVARVVMKDKNEFHFDLITGLFKRDWATKLKEFI